MVSLPVSSRDSPCAVDVGPADVQDYLVRWQERILRADDDTMSESACASAFSRRSRIASTTESASARCASSRIDETRCFESREGNTRISLDGVGRQAFAFVREFGECGSPGCGCNRLEAPQCRRHFRELVVARGATELQASEQGAVRLVTLGAGNLLTDFEILLGLWSRGLTIESIVRRRRARLASFPPCLLASVHPSRCTPCPRIGAPRLAPTGGHRYGVRRSQRVEGRVPPGARRAGHLLQPSARRRLRIARAVACLQSERLLSTGNGHSLKRLTLDHRTMRIRKIRAPLQLLIFSPKQVQLVFGRSFLCLCIPLCSLCSISSPSEVALSAFHGSELARVLLDHLALRALTLFNAEATPPTAPREGVIRPTA